MDKKEIRKKIRALRENLPFNQVVSASDIIFQKVLSLNEYIAADVVYAYIETNQEISTRKIIADALSKGKKVAAPRCNGKQMDFIYFTDISELKSGAYGILEPQGNEIANETKVFMLVPGMAFDKEGNRVGYGGGYYDRFFEKNRTSRIFKCALCYDFQLLDHVDAESHDEKVDIIVTNTKVETIARM